MVYVWYMTCLVEWQRRTKMSVRVIQKETTNMTTYYIAAHRKEILDGPFSTYEEAKRAWQFRMNNRPELMQGSVYKKSELARGVAAEWDSECALDEYYEERGL